MFNHNKNSMMFGIKQGSQENRMNVSDDSKAPKDSRAPRVFLSFAGIFGATGVAAGAYGATVCKS
jgi:hypothetical protein